MKFRFKWESHATHNDKSSIMETKKTLSYLNSKVWYRFLKVLFSLSFLLIFVTYNIVIYSEGTKRLDVERTVIQCNIPYTVNKIPDGYRQLNLKETSLDSYWSLAYVSDYKDFYSNTFNESRVKNILSKCSGVKDLDQIDTKFWQAFSDIKNDSATNPEAAALYNSVTSPSEDGHMTISKSVFARLTLDDLLTYKSHQFDIKPAYSYSEFLEYFIFGNIIILLLSQMVIRLFYYIILGSIRPKK